MILRVLDRVLVREFFKSHAGMFLLVIGLAFGFMSGREHRALAEFFIGSPALMLIPSTVWLVYGLKILGFNRERLDRSENRFLYQASLLPLSAQWLSFLLVAAAQFAPAIGYGLFLVLMSLQHHLVVPILQIVLTQLFLLFTATALLFYQVRRGKPYEIRVTAIKRFLDVHFTKPLLQFYLEWLVRNEFFLLLGTKLFTVLLLFGVTRLYVDESYDWRLIAMGAVAAFSGNFMLIVRVHRFENHVFSILRAIPFTWWRRIGHVMLVLTVLYFPEIIVLFRHFPGSVAYHHLLFVFLFGMSISMIFYSMLYINSLVEKDLTRLIFFAIILWILLILFNVSLILLTVINIVIGLWIFYRNFYRFEFSETKNAE